MFSNIGLNDGAEVMVYGSLHPSVNTFVNIQIADENEIQVNIMDMQVQAGTCDCGLFAVATAAALVNGIHP